MAANDTALPGTVPGIPHSTNLVTPPRSPSGVYGAPLMIDISLIDADPDQPRSRDNPGLRPESIAELAASFGPKGPKTPLSLRANPHAPGRYLINHGERRYLAGKLKGLMALPAFIDNDYDDADQVIENLQREDMTPREIADYIGRELARGKKKREIAARIGKSPSFVSQHVALLDLPEPVAAAFRTGRVGDVTVVNELVSAFRKAPALVARWLDNPGQELNRNEIRLLRRFLAGRDADAASPPDTASGQATANLARTSSPIVLRRDGASRGLTGAVLVEHRGRTARLLLSKRCGAADLAWVRFDDDGRESEVYVAELRLLAVVPA